MRYSLDVLRQCKLLELAYEHTHDEADAHGVPDRNDRIVLQALRCRIVPPIFLAEMFDQWIPTMRTSSAGNVSAKRYWREARQVVSMVHHRPGEWERALHHQMGIGSTAHSAESRGEYVYGFALDTITMKFEMVTGYGSHSLCLDNLLTEIFGPPSGWDKHWAAIAQRLELLIGGIVVHGVLGMTTPILVILEASADPRLVKKVVRYVKQQRLFIPVDHDFRYLPGT